MTRIVSIASAVYLLAYAAASILTGQQNTWLGDLSQLLPPLAFAALALLVARRSTRQVRVFWNLNAAHGMLWAVGQSVWTYYDLARGGVPIISPTDPIFFLASIPIAAALYGRPERDRSRWLFDIVVLDIVLIALFAIFTYAYFVVSLAATDGPEEVYNTNLTQLFNVRNLLLTLWATYVWWTASSPSWRRVLGLYAAGLATAFVGGIAYDVIDAFGGYVVGGLSDVVWMLPFAMLSLAAAQAYDFKLYEPTEPQPPLSRLPVVSLIAIALLVLIPAIDEAARLLLDVSPVAQALRTRIALGMMIPFGVVVFVREFLSRRALLRAGQELVTTREELAQKEKLAAVGHLVSGVAHELNNPLQGVLGHAELLALAQRDGPLSEELKAIRDNANRAAGIVRNLLTFAGPSGPTRSWTPVNAIVRDASQRRASSLQQSNITLRLQLAERSPLVHVDVARFELVLLNLLENAEAAISARRTAQSAGMDPSVSDAGEIVITTFGARDPERVVIEIADNGSGVRGDHLSKVFDPFFTTRASGEGMGLGLSVCYGIVREHGGLISGSNRATGGAVFTIELPAAAVDEDISTDDVLLANGVGAGAVPPTLPEPRAALTAGRSIRALVVDDEDSNAALVRRALHHAGYDVDSTTVSRRALAMIERDAYVVVIADIKMPEMNGQELYTRVCQLRPEMSGRFIFITGDIDGEQTLEFLDRSGCPYFMKPFNLERLTSAVDTLVNGQRPGA